MNAITLKVQAISLRGKALCAAAEILVEAGPDNMSLKSIADRAGIGIASMYHYFSCKDDLLLNLAVLGFDDLRREIVRRVRSDREMPLSAGSQAFLAFAADRPAFLSLMFNERLLARFEALRSAEQEAYSAFRSAIAGDERFPPEHRANVALALWAMGRGIASMISSQPGRAIPQAVLNDLLAGAGYLINGHAQIDTPRSATAS